jgi:hypothetical protein
MKPDREMSSRLLTSPLAAFELVCAAHSPSVGEPRHLHVHGAAAGKTPHTRGYSSASAMRSRARMHERQTRRSEAASSPPRGAPRCRVSHAFLRTLRGEAMWQRIFGARCMPLLTRDRSSLRSALAATAGAPLPLRPRRRPPPPRPAQSLPTLHSTLLHSKLDASLCSIASPQHAAAAEPSLTGGARAGGRAAPLDRSRPLRATSARRCGCACT